jgi:hypothetical protein
MTPVVHAIRSLVYEDNGTYTLTCRCGASVNEKGEVKAREAIHRHLDEERAKEVDA